MAEDVIKVITKWYAEPFTYVNNSYVDSSDVARCLVRYNPSTKTGALHINLRITKNPLPPSSDFLKIATIPSGLLKYPIAQTLSGQSSGVLLIDITTTGEVRLWNGTSENISGVMNWFRAEIPIILA